MKSLDLLVAFLAGVAVGLALVLLTAEIEAREVESRL